MSNRLFLVSVGDGVPINAGGHLYADPYQVDTENRLYLNGVYLAWYGQKDTSSMTYEAFCDLIEGLKLLTVALPSLTIDERHVKPGIGISEKDWTWEEVEKLLGINPPSSKKIGRIALEVGYVVDLNDSKMVQVAKEKILQEVADLVICRDIGEFHANIKVKEAPDLTEADIPHFLRDGGEEIVF